MPTGFFPELHAQLRKSFGIHGVCELQDLCKVTAIGCPRWPPTGPAAVLLHKSATRSDMLQTLARELTFSHLKSLGRGYSHLLKRIMAWNCSRFHQLMGICLARASSQPVNRGMLKTVPFWRRPPWQQPCQILKVHLVYLPVP